MVFLNGTMAFELSLFFERQCQRSILLKKADLEFISLYKIFDEKVKIFLLKNFYLTSFENNSVYTNFEKKTLISE
jgi:hypothetical protein